MKVATMKQIKIIPDVRRASGETEQPTTSNGSGGIQGLKVLDILYWDWKDRVYRCKCGDTFLLKVNLKAHLEKNRGCKFTLDDLIRGGEQ